MWLVTFTYKCMSSVPLLVPGLTCPGGESLLDKIITVLEMEDWHMNIQNPTKLIENDIFSNTYLVLLARKKVKTIIRKPWKDCSYTLLLHIIISNRRTTVYKSYLPKGGLSLSFCVFLFCFLASKTNKYTANTHVPVVSYITPLI